MKLKPLKIQNKLGYKPTSNIITPRTEKSINVYFNEINKINAAKLTIKEEKELFKKIAQGDENARKKIITSNLKFVIAVSKHYLNQGLEFEDLINEGNIGLMKAVEKFDTNINVKFISYAVWWIRQSILQAIMDKGYTVKVPTNKRESLKKVNRIIANLEKELHRQPSIDEIVDYAIDNSDKFNLKTKSGDIDHKFITDILISKMDSSSLDEPIYYKNGENTSLHEIIPSSDSPIQSNLENIDREINELFSTSDLTKQERLIMEMSFGVLKQKNRLNLEEIGAIYSISKERVRQIKENALRKLKYNPKIRILLEYTQS